MKPFVHNKTGNIYYFIGQVTNATNAQVGENMVLYTRNGNQYVREVNEFDEKFTELTLKVGDLVALPDGIYPVLEVNADWASIDTPNGPRNYAMPTILNPCRIVKPGATVVTRDGLEVTLLEPQDLCNRADITVRTPTGMAKIAFNTIYSVTAYNLDSLFSNID